jgi:hypothetical protein
MGYYENPPIIQPSRGSEIVSAAIVNAANSLSQGLLTAGERKRQTQKEHRLTIQKLQDRKNETDLLYNEKLSDWSLKQPNTNEAVDKKIHSIVQSKIILAADSKISLLNETDPAKRQQYLKNIRDADGFLNSSAGFAKSIAEQTATWRQGAKGATVGVPGGYVINGKDDKEINDNTAVAEILGGMTEGYTDTNIDVNPDENGDGVVMKITGRHKDGTPFERVINSKTFGKSEEEGGDGLLIPVESLDTFHTKAKEDVVDKKGNIYPGYLSQERETVDLSSKGNSGGGVGSDQYQIVNGQRLQEKLIKSKIREKADVTAAGMIKVDGQSRLRALLDYTLEQQPGYYDKNFKTKTPEEQKQILTDLLTEQSWGQMTKSLEKTVGQNGETVYWNPTADIKLKDKVNLSTANPRKEKEKPTTYKTEYYDDIISGYVPGEKENLQEGQIKYRTRSKLVENLNRLSGNSGKYVTREDLFEKFKKSKYVTADKFDTGLTMQEAIDQGKVKGTLDELYKKKYGNDQIFTRDGKKVRPVRGYDFNSAEGRVKLALDQTSDAGERKILQEKLSDARLMDWVRTHPRKQGESDQAYAARAQQRK